MTTTTTTTFGNMSLGDLPSEILDYLSTFLDLGSLLSLFRAHSHFYHHFKDSFVLWKRIALEYFCLNDLDSVLYRNYDDVNSDYDVHGSGGESEGNKYKNAVSKYKILRNNLRKGIFTAWRFNLDPSHDYLIRLNCQQRATTTSTMTTRSYDPSLKNRYDMSETFFSLDWNGDYAVMIVNSKNVSEIFVWKTRHSTPTFSYVSVKHDVQITCKNFAIYENFLIITWSKTKVILSSYDMKNELLHLGDVRDSQVGLNDDVTSNTHVDEFVEVLNGGKIITFSFRTKAPIIYLINVYDLQILSKFHLDPTFTRDFTLLYHVEHRPYYRNGVALNFPSKFPVNGMYEPIYDLYQHTSGPHFYLMSIRTDGIRLYPGGGIACFGMDITENGHILALINRLDMERAEGVGCVALYRKDSHVPYDDDKGSRFMCPYILHDFPGKRAFLLKGSYLNRQMDDWTGDHQIRLCHERNVAVVMTNSLKQIVAFSYDNLASLSDPMFSILYEINYAEFNLNDVFNTLTLAVSRNLLALADNATVILRDVKTGDHINVLKLPEHCSSSSTPDNNSSEDDFGLGFLLINDSDILAHYFCPHVFPDAFDIFKFYP